MRVIVTRPEHEAQAWVKALSQYGLDAVALPLISIHALADTRGIRAAWRNLDGYAAVMFVSGASVEHFFASRLAPDAGFGATKACNTRAWVTGPGTAAALLRHGWTRHASTHPPRAAASSIRKPFGRRWPPVCVPATGF